MTKRKRLVEVERRLAQSEERLARVEGRVMAAQLELDQARGAHGALLGQVRQVLASVQGLQKALGADARSTLLALAVVHVKANAMLCLAMERLAPKAEVEGRVLNQVTGIENDELRKDVEKAVREHFSMVPAAGIFMQGH